VRVAGAWTGGGCWSVCCLDVLLIADVIVVVVALCDSDTHTHTHTHVRKERDKERERESACVCYRIQMWLEIRQICRSWTVVR